MDILIEQNPQLHDEIDRKLLDFNRKHGSTPYFTGPASAQQKKELGFYIKRAGQLIAGANTWLTHDWLYLDELFVEESERQHQLGSQLLSAMEQYARAEALVGIYLETHDFQARGFYEKKGFALLGELPNFPRGNKMFILTKVFDAKVL